MHGKNPWKKTDLAKKLSSEGDRAGGDGVGVGWEAKVIKSNYSKKMPTGVLENPSFVHRPDT